jgi:hypothetical protein
MWRVYKHQNFADTSRDPDNIEITELGYFHKLEDAKKAVERKLNSGTRLHRLKDGSWYTSEMGSYAPSYYIEPIKVQ